MTIPMFAVGACIMARPIWAGYATPKPAPTIAFRTSRCSKVEAKGKQVSARALTKLPELIKKGLLTRSESLPKGVWRIVLINTFREMRSPTCVVLRGRRDDDKRGTNTQISVLDSA